MPLLIGARSPLFRAGRSAQQVFPNIVSVAGVSGIRSTVEGFNPARGQTYRASPDDGSGSTGSIGSTNFTDTAVFARGDVVIRPVGEIWESTRAQSLAYNYTISQSNLPTLSSPSWTRLDGVTTCNAPYDELYVLNDLTYINPSELRDGRTPNNVWRQALHRNRFASDYYRTFNINHYDETVNRYMPFPPDSNWNDEIAIGGSEGRVDSRGVVQWNYIGLSNPWRWMFGNITRFNTSCRITWNPDPDIAITYIEGSGLQNVDRVTITCFRSNGSQRFSRDAFIIDATQSWFLNFSNIVTDATDYYHVDFHSSGDGGFGIVSFGPKEVLSQSAELLEGSTMDIFDSSSKTSDNKGVIPGTITDGFNMRYAVDPSEDVQLQAKLAELGQTVQRFDFGQGFDGLSAYITRFTINRGDAHSFLNLQVQVIGN